LVTPVARRNLILPVRNLPTSEQLQSTRPAVRSPFAGILFGSPGQSCYGAKEAQLSGHLACESRTSSTIFLPHKTIVEKFLAFFRNRMFVTVVTGQSLSALPRVYFVKIYFNIIHSTNWRSLLRHCAASPKVAGSIRDWAIDVILPVAL